MKLFRALCLAAALLGSSAGFVVQHRLSFPPAMRERSVGQLRKAAALSVEAPAADCLHEAGRRSRARSRVALYAMGSDMGAERDAVRNAEELKTGVKLRSPDMDKLCSWLTREVTLWLDEDWIEREVHRLIGERAATSVRRMVNNGETGISAILFGVAEDLGPANFPRLFESDVNQWDIANKVSDLLLQSMEIDVCCTTAPLTGLPYCLTPPNETPGGSRFVAPVSTVDKYIFLQKALDGRAPVQDVNAAVVLSLKEEDFKRMGVAGSAASALNFFGDDFKAIEDLDEALERKLAEDNKRDSDLDPLLEALLGEELLQFERTAGGGEFVRRETCVKWLHMAGGY